MRRWPMVVGVAVLSMVVVSGCSVPAGTDGDLVDDWPAMADPQLVLPTVGACYNTHPTSVWDGTIDHPVACTSAHFAETVYVGTFAGDAGSRVSPPSSGGPEQRAAFRTCGQKANDFLGGDWHTAVVRLYLVIPDFAAWGAGARWFQCELSSGDSENDEFVSMRTSLKDGLRGSRPLADTCITADDVNGDLGTVNSTDCAKPHRGEFAGTYTAPAGAYPAPGSAGNPGRQGCKGVVALYVGFGAWNSRSDLGWMWWDYGQTTWDLGDHTFRCYALAYSGDRTRLYTGSLKNIGNAPIKS